MLDACVLFQIATADALVSLAVEGLFAAKWTTDIEDEWLPAARRRYPERAAALTARRDLLRETIVDWHIARAAWSAMAWWRPRKGCARQQI